MQTVTWTYILILSYHFYCLYHFGLPWAFFSCKSHCFCFHHLYCFLPTCTPLMVSSWKLDQKIPRSNFPPCSHDWKGRQASHYPHLLQTLIYKHIHRIEWKNKRKEGGKKGKEGKRGEKERFGEEVGRRKILLYYHFFLIGGKIPVKHITPLLTNCLRENPYHLINGGFSLNTGTM